jgi:Vitamin K-dependent gamma-carboxylase
MQNAMTTAIDGLKKSARSVAADWNAFWYTPADPTLLGLIRVLTGLMLLYTHAVWGLALADFFGPFSWLSPALVRTMHSGQYVVSFWFWVPEGWMWPAYAVSMVILGLFTVGLWTRVTSALALFVGISYANRVPAALFGLDQINIMLTLYLTIGASGSALSLDRFLSRRLSKAEAADPAPSISANLAQRLIQVHMCVIYFFAGISKLQGPSWWSGEAMWRAFANLEYQSMDLTWLASHPWIVNAMTHVSVLWEISFCALIWRPRWRPLMLALAVLLHVGIGACLGMWTFGLIMLVGCAAFLPNEGARRLVFGRLGRASSAAGSDVEQRAQKERGALRSPRTPARAALNYDQAGQRPL